jgi:hypothetical protein
MNASDICKRHRRFTIAFTAATMAVYVLSSLGFIAVCDLLGFAGEWVAMSTIASAVFLSGTLAATCYFFIKCDTLLLAQNAAANSSWTGGFAVQSSRARTNRTNTLYNVTRGSDAIHSSSSHPNAGQQNVARLICSTLDSYPNKV